VADPIRAADVQQLAVATRNGVIENRFFGSAVVVDATGNIMTAIGDPAADVYPRSALKPFQAIASLRCGAPLAGQNLALACGSHIGSVQHQQIAAEILAAAGLSATDLQCPAVFPGSASQVAQAALEVAPLPLERSRLAHNCSGKHAGFLSATVAAGAPPETYLAPESVVQQHVVEVLEQYCQTKLSHVGVDGCGAPTPMMSLTALARGFSALGLAGTDRSAQLHTAMVAQAMLDYPEAVQGRRRADSVVLEHLGLITKTGADGILAMAAPDGTAVAVSMIDSTHRATHLVALVLLANAAPEVLPVTALTDVIDMIVQPVYGGNQPVGSLKVSAEVLALLDER